MALYQVVEHSGQKSLIDVAAGGGSVAVPAPYNTETWITESGTFTAPVTGWYAVWMIGGGNGGLLYNTRLILFSGPSGIEKEFLLHLTAGESVPVTIGAGGIGAVLDVDDAPASAWGGSTSFGEISTGDGLDIYDTSKYPLKVYLQNWVYYGNISAGTMLDVYGSGPGGGIPQGSSGNGFFYGAGGGAHRKIGSLSDDMVGNGAAGAIRLRYYDPNKSSN